MHTVLSAWHTTGRYLQNVPPRWLRFIYGAIGHDWTKQAKAKPAARPVLKPKHPAIVAMLNELQQNATDYDVLRHWKRLDVAGAFDVH
jgi:hypothetical protein